MTAASIDRLIRRADEVAIDLAKSPENIGRIQLSCPRHGEYMARITRLRSRDIYASCPGCTAERKEKEEAERQARITEENRKHVADCMERAAVPARFAGRTLATFKATSPEQQKALSVANEFVANWDSHLKRGSWLVFSGLPGTGKSHLAIGILQALIPTYVGRYLTCSELIQTIRSTWRKDSDAGELQILDKLEAFPLLVIDEVGVQYGTESEQNHIFDVLDRRYREMKPTILLTNQNKDGFREYVGDRVYDRMTECARWVPFTWDSYRPQARKEIAE